MGARGPFFRTTDVKELLEPYYSQETFGKYDYDYRRWYDIRELRQQVIGFDVVDRLCCRIGHPELMVHLEEVQGGKPRRKNARHQEVPALS